MEFENIKTKKIKDYKEIIKYKSLYNKARKIIRELSDYIEYNLKFETEPIETKKAYYKAIDCLIEFKDNLNIKKGFKIKNE